MSARAWILGAAGVGLIGVLAAGVMLSPKGPAPVAPVASTPAKPKPVPPVIPADAIKGKVGQSYAWSEGDQPNGVTYVVDGILIRLWAVPGETVALPAWRIVAPTGEVIEGTGPAGLSNAAASFTVSRMDASSPLPQVIVSAVSGGAHCCTQIAALDFRDGGWAEIDVGSWDTGMPAAFPTDLDGDGLTEFSMVDNRFLYAFGSYAGNRPPPQVMALRGRKAVDVSAEPRYRPVFEAALPSLKRECQARSNAACAGYVAAAARLDRGEEAWAVMQTSYDRSAGWWPQGCRVPTPKPGCPAGQRIEFQSYPAALLWFLGEHGYTPRPDVPARLPG